MFLRKTLFLGLISIHFCYVQPSCDPIWYARPAQGWEEALPIGNGRLAAMVFGRVEKDRIENKAPAAPQKGPAPAPQKPQQKVPVK